MKLYEKYQIKKDQIAEKQVSYSLRAKLKGTKNNNLLRSNKFHTVSDSTLMCFYKYYLHKPKELKVFIERLFVYLDDYFFGTWRCEVQTDEGKIDPEWWKRISWASFFRETIFWGSCIGAWDKIKKIAQYPTEECLNSEPWEHIGFRVWYLVIAAVLRDEPLESLGRYTDLIDKLKSRREKLLLDILRPILYGDAEKANGQLSIYLKYYKKFEFKKPEITEKVSIDGTFLINFGRYRGLKIEYPEEYTDHIVTL